MWQWKTHEHLVAHSQPNDEHVSRLSAIIDAETMVHVFPNKIPKKKNNSGLVLHWSDIKTSKSINAVNLLETHETFRIPDICSTFLGCIHVSQQRSNHVTMVCVSMPEKWLFYVKSSHHKSLQCNLYLPEQCNSWNTLSPNSSVHANLLSIYHWCVYVSDWPLTD